EAGVHFEKTSIRRLASLSSAAGVLSVSHWSTYFSMLVRLLRTRVLREPPIWSPSHAMTRTGWSVEQARRRVDQDATRVVGHDEAQGYEGAGVEHEQVAGRVRLHGSDHSSIGAVDL